MKIALLGGTGKLGQGLALRWCKNHHILIGSRSAEKANSSARNYLQSAKRFYGKDFRGTIEGGENVNVAVQADVVVLSVPYQGLSDFLIGLKPRVSEEQLLLCPIVPIMKTEKGFVHTPFKSVDMVTKRVLIRSIAEMVADELPPRARVVAALHTLSSKKLAQLGRSLDCDSFVCGDDKSKIVIADRLIEQLPGVRAINIGPLSNAMQVEAATVMLRNVTEFSGIREPVIKIL